MDSTHSTLSSPYHSLTGLLIGDELGQIKRIDFRSDTGKGCRLQHLQALRTITNDTIESVPSPERSVASIHSLDDHMYVIANKPNTVSLYNSVTNEYTCIKTIGSVGSDVSIIGAQPISKHILSICYDNGNLITHNIQNEMLSQFQTKRKAIQLLGLDLNSSYNQQKQSMKASKSTESSHNRKPLPKPSQLANLSGSSISSSLCSSSTSIYSPNLNTSNACVTCFKVCNNNVAIAGRNVDLKVFDFNTNQNIFAAKSSGRDWLGLRQPTYVSGIEWVGGNSRTNASPSMIATCSRNDSCVKIYDIKCRQRKAVMIINLKDETFNNDSNPPSFTSICATSMPDSKAIPKQNLILGTTIGRMIAIELRFNTHPYRKLGKFNGFGGGAIRDIKYVHQSSNSYKIISCSLDRFARIHTFNTSANSSTRDLDLRLYTKTRPTCIQPLICGKPINTTSNIDAPNIPHLDEDFEDLDFDD